MADNITAPGAGTVLATDEINVGGTLVHYPITKMAFGAPDTATLVTGTAGLPVNLIASLPAGSAVIGAVAQSGSWNVGVTGTVAVSGPLTDAQLRATPVPVSGTVAVTGTFWQATQPVSLAALPALAAGSNVIGGVTQSGTWNITNISGTVSLPTGAATSALQTTGNTSLANLLTSLGLPNDAAWTTGSGSAVALLKTIATQAADLTTPSPVVGGAVAATALTATGGVNAVGTTALSITVPAATRAVEFYNNSDVVIWLSLTTTAAAASAGSFPVPPYSATTGAGFYAPPPGWTGTISLIAASGSAKPFTCLRFA